MFSDLFIFVDVEMPNTWQDALPLAVQLANDYDATVNLLSVVPDFGMAVVEQFFPEGTDHELNKKVLEILEDFIAEQVPAHIRTRPIVAEGSVRECILRMSKEVNADLILMPPTRAGDSHYDLGATAAHVVRHAHCSVMILRDSTDEEEVA